MLLHIILLCAAPTAAPQDPANAPAQDPAVESTNVEALRGRIREMRMNLLLGGEKVRQAESEAIDFYHQKIGSVDQRLDTLHVDLSEKRASYDVALDRALNAPDAEARLAAMRDASAVRGEIASMEGEAEDLRQRRKGLAKLVGAVEEREVERERLSTKLETSAIDVDDFGWAMGGIGLAPSVPVQAATSPIDDEALIQDLLARDPDGARRILFEADPSSYWRRFPLRPPAGELRAALAFPLPDLPGRR